MISNNSVFCLSNIRHRSSLFGEFFVFLKLNKLKKFSSKLNKIKTINPNNNAINEKKIIIAVKKSGMYSKKYKSLLKDE